MKPNPHNLKFDERPWLEFLCMFPLALSVFTLGSLPFFLIWLAIEQPEEIPGVIAFFAWMIFGAFITWLNERDAN